MYLLTLKFGIIFIAFLYVENEDKIKVHKYQFNSLFPIVIVYSIEDIGGGSLPLRAHFVGRYPLCGDTPQRPDTATQIRVSYGNSLNKY